MTIDVGALQGIAVVERSATVAGAYTGRLLAALGADVIMVEPPAGHALRGVPPLIPGSGTSSTTHTPTTPHPTTRTTRRLL